MNDDDERLVVMTVSLFGVVVDVRVGEEETARAITLTPGGINLLSPSRTLFCPRWPSPH